MVQDDRWIRTSLGCSCSLSVFSLGLWVSQLVQRSPLWLASWLPVLDKSRGSKSAEVQRAWGREGWWVMMIGCNSWLGMML